MMGLLIALTETSYLPLTKRLDTCVNTSLSMSRQHWGGRSSYSVSCCRMWGGDCTALSCSYSDGGHIMARSWSSSRSGSYSISASQSREGRRPWSV
jgi:hypothetical protein